MASKTVYEYAYRGDFNYVKQQLDENPNLLTQLDDSKRLLIHWVAVGGNVKLFTYLLELNSPCDMPDDTETTPLILASSAGNNEIVTMLLEKGVSVNQKTSTGHSALQYAASKGHLNICAKLLANGANINIADNQGSTPLQRAVAKNNFEIVQFFIQEYLSTLDINFRDVYGNTALHLACEEECEKIVELLLDNGADPTITNKNRQTPKDISSRKILRIFENKGF